MNSFTFQNTTRIHFGKAQIGKLSKELASYQRIMLVYGGGSIFTNGVYRQVKDQLAGKQYVEFGGVEPNPRYETLIKAVEVARSENVDFLLAVGGGSVIDGAKFIAAATLFTSGDPWLMLSENAKFSKALPLGVVLTLPATGSEMNGNAVITRESVKQKLAFGSRLLLPVFAILDPETMYSLPFKQISNGIADAFVHVMEQYLTYPVNAPVQDRFAEALLLTLLEEGPKVLAYKTDYDACANLMWAATMALNGLIVAGVPDDWSTHMIGHELTALFGIDHAQSLCIVLPGVMELMRHAKAEKIVQYGIHVWGIDEDSDDEIINEAIFKTEQFFNSIAIDTRLCNYSISADDVEQVCKRLENRALKWGEHKNIEVEMVRKILTMRL